MGVDLLYLDFIGAIEHPCKSKVKVPEIDETTPANLLPTELKKRVSILEEALEETIKTRNEGIRTLYSEIKGIIRETGCRSYETCISGAVRPCPDDEYVIFNPDENLIINNEKGESDMVFTDTEIIIILKSFNQDLIDKLLEKYSILDWYVEHEWITLHAMELHLVMLKKEDVVE